MKKLHVRIKPQYYRKKYLFFLKNLTLDGKKKKSCFLVKFRLYPTYEVNNIKKMRIILEEMWTEFLYVELPKL